MALGKVHSVNKDTRVPVSVTKNGGRRRLCVKYLDAATVKDAFLLPKVDQSFDAYRVFHFRSYLQLLASGNVSNHSGVKPYFLHLKQGRSQKKK